MADILQALQSVGGGAGGAASQPVDINAALNYAGTAPQNDAPVNAATPATPGSRAAQGFSDYPVGLGQIAEHVAETPLNWARTGIRGGLNTVGAHDAADLFDNVSASNFDNIVRQREHDYQQSRVAAQNTGIDWWRIGGAAANPLNYIGGGPAETVMGRIAQAGAQGAAVSAVQPSTTPGSFWWDKAKSGFLGSVLGLGTAGTIEAAIPLMKYGVNGIRNWLGVQAPAAAGPGADAVVHSALNAHGVDPNSVDLNVLSGLKQEVQEAISHGVEPSPQGIAARAQAESLPFPIYLMRPQATGEPISYANMMALRGIKGVGEPITERLTQQNAAAINNLDALGAKGAMDPVSWGSKTNGLVTDFWNSLQTQKDALYSAVRNNRGQSAAMDGIGAGQRIVDELDSPEASHVYQSLPDNIRNTVDDLRTGKLPMTIAQWQRFDQDWGLMQRGADGSEGYAIGQARQMLGEAKITDSIGDEAKQAYIAARQAHAQQMSLVDPKLLNGRPNPNYQPLVDDVIYKGKPPESLFQSHILGNAPSVAGKNLTFLSQLDPAMDEQTGRTLMGVIKDQALNGASDERGTVSNAVLTKWTNPVQSARLDAILPQPAAATFRNLAGAVENAKRFPTASAVPTSNTASALANYASSALKGGAFEKGTSILGKVPIVGPILNAKDIASELERSRLAAAVQEHLIPGVTLNSLLSTTPGQAFRRGLLERGAVPLGAAALNESTNAEQ